MNQEDPQIQNRPITNDQKSASRVASPLDNMGAIRVYALAPHLRSRITSIYMVSSFVGAATGSALGAFRPCECRAPGNPFDQSGRNS